MGREYARNKANRIFLWMTAASLVLLLASILLGGCVTSTETASKDTLTTHAGEYPPPPAGIKRVRVGVPPFEVKPAHVAGEQLENLAADELTTLAFRTHRFNVIERAQMQQLLREQELEGIVRWEELAAKGQVRGVDYLFLGKVTNFRVKEEETESGFGLARIPRVTGAADIETTQKMVHVDCGVDLRLVDPAEGYIMAAAFGEYKRTDTARAMGVEILGTGARSKSDLRISKENRGKILRLALDEAVRKMLPDIDYYLQSSAQGTSGEDGARFCPQCGARVGPDDNFCGECGFKLK